MKVRLLTLAAFLVLVLSAVGCESFVYSYDCRGTLLKPDGSPASCVQVHVDTEGGPPRQQVSWDETEGWTDVIFTAVTNPHGRFRVHCSGKLFTSWFFNPYPEPPKLPEVYVWTQTSGALDRHSSAAY